MEKAHCVCCMEYIYSCKSWLPTNDDGLFGGKELEQMQTKNNNKKSRLNCIKNFSCSSSLHSKLLPSKQILKQSDMFYFGLNWATALSYLRWVPYNINQNTLKSMGDFPWLQRWDWLPVVKETASLLCTSEPTPSLHCGTIGQLTSDARLLLSLYMTYLLCQGIVQINHFSRSCHRLLKAISSP